MTTGQVKSRKEQQSVARSVDQREWQRFRLRETDVGRVTMTWQLAWRGIEISYRLASDRQSHAMGRINQRLQKAVSGKINTGRFRFSRPRDIQHERFDAGVSEKEALQPIFHCHRRRLGANIGHKTWFKENQLGTTLGKLRPVKFRNVRPGYKDERRMGITDIPSRSLGRFGRGSFTKSRISCQKARRKWVIFCSTASRAPSSVGQLEADCNIQCGTINTGLSAGTQNDRRHA